MPSPTHWRDTLLLTSAAALLYAVLRQDAVHHLDMHGVVRSLVAPPGEAPRYGHFAYQWLAWLLHAMLGPEAPLFRPLQWASVVAAALAVGAGHRAVLAMGLPRGAAAAAAAGAMTVGASLYFATTAEIHAVFWLPANLALGQAAHALRNRSPRHALVAGAWSGLATAVHSSGQLLPALFLLAALATAWLEADRWRRSLLPTALAWAAHFGAFSVCAAIDARSFGFADAAASRQFLIDTLARWDGFGPVPGLLWRELLLPYAPFPLLALAAMARPGLRRFAVALVTALGGFLLVDLALLHGLVEHGAYALPLAVPLAALGARLLPGKWPWLPVLIALPTGLSLVLHQDPARIPKPDFAQGLSQWRAGHPGATFVLGGYAEIDSMLVHGGPLWHRTILEPEFAPWFDLQTPATAVRAGLGTWAARAAAAGGPLVLSREALALFVSIPRNAAVLFDAATFQVEEVRSGGFQGYLVQKRGG